MGNMKLLLTIFLCLSLSSYSQYKDGDTLILTNPNWECGGPAEDTAIVVGKKIRFDYYEMFAPEYWDFKKALAYFKESGTKIKRVKMKK